MCNKIKQRCSGAKQYSTCIEYELDLPEFTKITDQCTSIEDTTEDTYILIGDIRNEIDLSELGESCLTYVQEEGKTIVKNVLLKYEEAICDYEERITELENGTHICNMSITGCNLDLGDLVNICEEDITTVGELLQVLVNQHNTNNINTKS